MPRLLHERLAGVRHKGRTAMAVATEFAVIFARAAPVIARRIPLEYIPAIREKKLDKGKDSLSTFHENFLMRYKAADYSGNEDIKERYKNIFGDPEDERRKEHGKAFWDVQYLGKGWNSFAVRFQTVTGRWVIKTGNPLSPNPYFFIDESNPAHLTEMQQNINNLREASEKAGLNNFVPLPQELSYLPVGGSTLEQRGVTIHVMPFVELVSAGDLRNIRKHNPQQFARLIEEMDKLAEVRRNLQLETLSELDLNGHGNVGIVWKTDSQTRERYPGIQIIDPGLRYYGLETHATDAFFDLTGFLQGVGLRRRIRGKIFEEFGKDLQTEWAIMHDGQKQRAQLNEASRRARRTGDIGGQPQTSARQKRGMVA